MKFPDFIIVGAAKCGTTALWYNLDKHPDITMISKTTSSIEFNFWGGNHLKKGVDWYKSKFEGNFCGEKSTLYYTNIESMRKIHRYIPDVKMILCARNPVDRAYSNWQMNNKGRKVLKEFSFDLFINRYAKTGQYYENIKNNILPFFDKKQLYVYITEWGKASPTIEMNKLFNFLNIPQLNLPKKEIGGVLLSSSKGRQEDIAQSRKENFYRVWDRHKDKLTGHLRDELLKYYEPHNEKFFEFIGYEIKEWNR